MLMYDSIIVPLIEYTKEKYKNSFQFGITTNVTLLNKERLEFFKNNNVFILLSIDGDKET
jgi:sulfatase maturation enzyme AslB (radical SAM superfamily)